MSRTLRPLARPRRWLLLSEGVEQPHAHNSISLCWRQAALPGCRHASSSSRKPLRSPTVARLGKKAAAGTPPPPHKTDSTSADPTKRDITINELDLLELFNSAIPLLEVEFSAAECLDAVKTYRAAAGSQSGQVSGKALEEEHGLSPYKLHLVGVMLLVRGGSKAEHVILASQLLHTASSAGYVPSTLTILSSYGALNRHNRRGDNTVTSSRFYRDAQARFDQYLRRDPAGRSDPDALTLAGKMAAAAGDAQGALYWFREAEKAGSAGAAAGAAAPDAAASAHPAPRAKRWAWEPGCMLALGQLYQQAGRRDEALAALRTAALELDNAEAYAALAGLLPPDAPEREAYLTKAAISGVAGAARGLAELEAERAAVSDGGDGKGAGREEHAMLAREWLRLAAALSPGSEAGAEEARAS